mmetsp:Transcript_27653/g.54369  ORF Transcript_27653/g.54369 Transcript_27653/m.54369 type:complete len:210 (+) Transcript_27653:2178-2807(+)
MRESPQHFSFRALLFMGANPFVRCLFLCCLHSFQNCCSGSLFRKLHVSVFVQQRVLAAVVQSTGCIPKKHADINFSTHKVHEVGIDSADPFMIFCRKKNHEHILSVTGSEHHLWLSPLLFVHLLLRALVSALTSTSASLLCTPMAVVAIQPTAIGVTLTWCSLQVIDNIVGNNTSLKLVAEGNQLFFCIGSSSYTANQLLNIHLGHIRQ